MLSDNILSHEQIRVLLERNNANPELCRPVYIAWTDNKRVHVDTLPPQNHVCQQTWLRQLHSKKWRVQRKGEKTARVVERAIRVGGEWRMVPLNARA